MHLPSTTADLSGFASLRALLTADCLEQDKCLELTLATPSAPRREAEAAKRAAMEKHRAAQGLGPEGQAAERTLQATTAEIEANKRCVLAPYMCQALLYQ